MYEKALSDRIVAYFLICPWIRYNMQIIKATIETYHINLYEFPWDSLRHMASNVHLFL